MNQLALDATKILEFYSIIRLHLRILITTTTGFRFQMPNFHFSRFIREQRKLFTSQLTAFDMQNILVELLKYKRLKKGNA